MCEMRTAFRSSRLLESSGSDRRSMTMRSRRSGSVRSRTPSSSTSTVECPIQRRLPATSGPPDEQPANSVSHLRRNRNRRIRGTVGALCPGGGDLRSEQKHDRLEIDHEKQREDGSERAVEKVVPRDLREVIAEPDPDRLG